MCSMVIWSCRNVFLGYKKAQKVETLTFFLMGLSFGLFENGSFSIICFRKYRPGKCAYYIVIGLVHGFRPKGAMFPFFFGNIGKENVFSDILE